MQTIDESLKLVSSFDNTEDKIAGEQEGLGSKPYLMLGNVLINLIVYLNFFLLNVFCRSPNCHD